MPAILRHRISAQIREPSLIQKSRTQDPRVIDLSRPGFPRVAARHAGRVGAAHRVLRIVVVKLVHVRPQHQRLVRGELLVQTPVNQCLPIMARIGKVPIRRQHEGGQGTRKICRAVLPSVIACRKEESLIFDQCSANRS